MKFRSFLVFVCLFFCFMKTSFAYSKAPIDITTATIKDLKKAMEEGYLTSELLVKLYLERIEVYNDKYDAVLFVHPDALEEARKSDERRKNGDKIGVLEGIPIIVKTNIDVVGLPTTAGAKALGDNYPKEDAEVVKKLKAEGAIIIASANMSEFALMAGSSNSSYARVKNAYNPNRTPYGSSGGSAVSIALSFATAALGTDTNSSVRAPASAANLVGMRPSLGLVSTDGVIPYDTTRDTVGVLTKTVEDNALILSVIDTVDVNYQSNGNLKGLRIGVPLEFLKGGGSLKPNQNTDEDIYNLMMTKINEMESAGAEIIYLEKFLTSSYYNIWDSTKAGFTFCDAFNEYLNGTTGTIRSFSSLAASSSNRYSLSGYAGACNKTTTRRLNEIENIKDRYRSHVQTVFSENDLDVIIYPTSKNKIHDVNYDSGLVAPGTYLTSAIGFTSMSVPLGFIEGLPYGIEFLALKNEENKLYEITGAYESLNDTIIVPENTPSLYEIPEEVVTLKAYYENEDLWYSLQNNEIYKKEATALYQRIETYFLEYNINQNYIEEASVLNKEIKEFNVSSSSKKETEKEKVEQKGEENYLVIILALFDILLFIFLAIKIGKK